MRESVPMIDPEILQRWKRAVVHLEGAGSHHISYSLGDDIPVEAEAYLEQLTSRHKRRFGTAVFLEHGGAHFLLTARHVMRDEDAIAAFGNRVADKIGQLVGEEQTPRRDFDIRGLVSELEWVQHKPWHIVFRAPSLDEVLSMDAEELDWVRFPFMMNLGTGSSQMLPITFASDVDLAIVSLEDDTVTTRFRDSLLTAGLEPIPSNLIGEGPGSEGSDVFTVGYPMGTSQLQQLEMRPATANWMPSIVSLPTFSFGRVGMRHEALKFFWSDMTIAPGNSGGPVVDASGHLVGIVSAQSTVMVEPAENVDADAPALFARFPFARSVSASEIPALLEQQVEKDARRKEAFRRP